MMASHAYHPASAAVNHEVGNFALIPVSRPA